MKSVKPTEPLDRQIWLLDLFTPKNHQVWWDLSWPRAYFPTHNNHNMTESMISYIFLKIYNVAISKLDLMYQYCHASCCLNLMGQKHLIFFFWLHTGHTLCSNRTLMSILKSNPCIWPARMSRSLRSVSSRDTSTFTRSLGSPSKYPTHDNKLSPLDRGRTAYYDNHYYVWFWSLL